MLIKNTIIKIYMDIQNKNSTIKDSFPSTIKNSKKLIIQKIYLNKNPKNKSNSIDIKLPSIKSTKNNSYLNINSISDDIQVYKNKSCQKYNFGNKIEKNFLNINNNNIYEISNNNIISQGHQIESKIQNLKQSYSAILLQNKKDSLPKYNIPNAHIFHKKLMSMNKLNHEKNIREKYLEMVNKDKINNDTYIKSIIDEKNEKEIRTGIFGPRTNIVSVIRAKMESLKYDNEYKKVDEDIKEMIKDEIMDAQVKLKRKPIDLCAIKGGIRPLYLKKMDKYRYLSTMNEIRQLNQKSNSSIIIQDGNIMIKLINDAFNLFRNQKSKKI